MKEYRYTVITLSIGGIRKKYILELQTDDLYEATTRARDIFESYRSSSIVVEVYCRGEKIKGAIEEV